MAKAKIAQLDLGRLREWLREGKIQIFGYGHHSNALKNTFLVRKTAEELPDRPLLDERRVLEILGSPLSEEELARILASGLCEKPVPSGKPEWYVYHPVRKEESEKYGKNFTPRRPGGETWSDTP
ncbi:MAG: hypothetical protein AAB597_02765 [Patescibacteria group bacterium]